VKSLSIAHPAKRVKAKQLSLLNLGPRKYEFGGKESTGARKVKRPFIPNKAMHVTMRAPQARGSWNMLKDQNPTKVRGIITRFAKKNFIRIQHYANVGNHLHIMLRAKSRVSFANFLRTITCLISRVITGARKGKSLTKRFFEHIAHSRVVISKRAELILWQYINANITQSKWGKDCRDVELAMYGYRRKYGEIA